MSLLHQGRRNLVARELVVRHPYVAPALHPYIFPLYHPHSLDVLIFWDIPSSGRSGHVLISGAIVGAEHGALNAVIQEVQELKVKRSMFAETEREKLSVLEAIRASEWNAEMNPVSVTTIEPGVIHHDFSERSVSVNTRAFESVSPCLIYRSCQIPVTFMLRNFSMTHPSKYTLKLASGTTANDPSGTKCVTPRLIIW
jgi:trafficking protein particle complex subunit 8